MAKKVDNGTEASGNTFTGGNPATNTLGTIVDESWLNAVQDEIANVVLDSDSGIASLSQDNSSVNQMVTAIRSIIDTKIAASGGGGGGGGDATGTEVKVTESALGSDASTSGTSSIQAHSLSYTPIASGNDRYVDFQIDWSAKDASAGQAESIVELQKYNGSWSTVKTLYNKLSLPQGKVMVNTSKATLGSDASTSSGSNDTTGLQLNYSANSASNKRVVRVGLDNEVADSNGPGIHVALVLQYFNGSWIDLKEVRHRLLAGGANQSVLRNFLSFECEHLVSDSAPQYRIVHRVADSQDGGDSSVLYTGSWIEVSEYEDVKITDRRNVAMFTLRDTDDNSSPQYRIMHKVANGDSSIVHSGSIIRVREFN